MADLSRVGGRVLPRRFYGDDARAVAPQLLNKVLVHDDAVIGPVAVRIVEVEAYAGAEDAGSHGFRGRTPRTTVMFGAPGHLYVYFTYGMHWCANVVTGADGVCSAVLLRAGAPLVGLDAMRGRRRAARQDRDLCAGPARLTQALGIDGGFDGADVVRGAVRILDDGTTPPTEPGRSTRIGLSAGRGNEHPWRWFVDGNEHVSRARGARG